MKKVIQDVSVNSLSLFLTSALVPGLKIEGVQLNFLFAGLLLTLGDYILKPILKIITLPFNIITFGLFSLLINAVSLFLITIIYEKININAFYFQGISYNGFEVPGFNVNIFLSYFIVSVIIYSINKFISWLFLK